MLKYAIVVDEVTKACNVGIGTDTAYYKSIGMTEMEVEQCSWNGGWYVAGYVPKEPEEHVKQVRLSNLKSQLLELDNKAIRSLRAKAAGTATEEDEAYLEENELMAEQIRAEIRELENV